MSDINKQVSWALIMAFITTIIVFGVMFGVIYLIETFN